MRILSLDAGSSSLKFALYTDGTDELHRIARGIYTANGANLEIAASPKGAPRFASRESSDPAAWSVEVSLADLFAALDHYGIGAPTAIGHRLVFGGPERTQPTRATPEVLADLERFVPLYPLHLRSELDLVRSVRTHQGDVPQVLCFDTAFHQAMPDIAKRYPLPSSLDPIVRRYGYHGLSYEYILTQLQADTVACLIIAHLGNGASLAAVRDGRPVDTTMGFSTLGGLMMGTRPGDLDPGVLLHLLNVEGLSAQQLTTLVNEQCGLLGVSGTSSDMQTLLEDKRTGVKAATFAIDLFAYQARKHIGALVAVLGGLDTLVFTGGIGEHAAPVRQLICDGLQHLGLTIDPARNDANASLISQKNSAVSVRVIPTDESLMVARHTRRLLSAEAS
jgi:acetate kinase